MRCLMRCKALIDYLINHPQQIIHSDHPFLCSDASQKCYREQFNKVSLEDTESCQCHPACNEVIYGVTLSQAVWPSEAALAQAGEG